MDTWYGTYKLGAVVHAVGYNGKFLCGRKGPQSMECGAGLEWVDCKRCLKKLPAYLMKYAVRTKELNRLKQSLEDAKKIIDNIGGDETGCSVQGISGNNGLRLYLQSWVIPGMERMIKHFED